MLPYNVHVHTIVVMFVVISKTSWSPSELCFIFGRQVIVMLVVLLIVFAVCWLPFQIAVLYSEYHSNTDQVIECSFHFFRLISDIEAF